MNKLRIVAVLVGIEFAYFIYNWAVSFYRTFSKTHEPWAFVPLFTTFFITIIGVVCFFRFLATKLKKSQPLRAFLFYQCFSGLIWTVNGLLIYGKAYMVNVGRDPWEIIQVFASASIFPVVNFISLALLQQTRIPKCETLYAGGDAVTFSPVDNALRFGHCLIDMVFLAIISAATLVILRSQGLLQVQLIVYEVVLSFVYYFLMETFFKVTFGKIFTQCVVVNEQGQKAGVWEVLKRTVCRFIPLEGVSFLFKDRGWHDQFSGTYVVRDKYEWENKKDDFDTYFTGEPESEPTTTLIP
jgi:uncharacterized RDD family membrane protein YckC